jgi:ketosteroid isomerase-like protein
LLGFSQIDWGDILDMSVANITAIQNLYGAYGRRDMETLIKGFAPDIAWHAHGRAGDFPGLGPRKGLDQLREFFHLVTTNVDFSAFSPNEFYADKDKVFVLGHYAMTVKKTGHHFASDFVHVMTFKDGRIVKFDEFLDTAGLAAAYRG